MDQKTKSQLELTESEMVECWNQALGNDGIPYKDSIMQAGIFAERFCLALYIRVHKKPTRMNFDSLIKLFKKEGVFDNELESYAHNLRKDSNSRRHSTTTFRKVYLDIVRLKMIEMINWYLKFNKVTLKHLNLALYSKRLAKSAASTFLNLHKNGYITKDDVLDRFGTTAAYQDYELSDKTRITQIPVYAGLLIDESGSLQYEKNMVIEGQNEAIAAIRDSAICKKGILHLIQQVFHDEIKILNPLTPVKNNGADGIVLLNSKNYHPWDRQTHLYDAIHQMITLLIRESNDLQNEKFRLPEISIGVITDGLDFGSEYYTAKDVKALIDSLRDQGILKSSVLIGWTSKNLSQYHMQKLKNDLGFDEYICFDISDRRSIRQAFRFWSEMIENL